MKRAIFVVVVFAVVAGCAPQVKSTRALTTTDQPNVWLEIVTDDASANGVYRCTDGPPPVCTRARLVR